MALKTFVFDNKEYTLEEVVEGLKNNYPDEHMRRKFLNRSPKFGNDDDMVDGYAAEVMSHFCHYVKTIKGVNHGMGFFAQPFTYLWLVEAGRKTGASPDGRKCGENLAYSVSPMQGRDSRGLTAVFNSISKLPSHLAAGSISTIIEIDPVLFEENKLQHLTVLLQTAIEKGVGQVQFNVVNEQTLRRAQEEPEKYSSLAVRVSGFSQRFCLLDKNLQDHIIARTKHRNL
jgi:formate C-acetyltransferase